MSKTNLKGDKVTSIGHRIETPSLMIIPAANNELYT